MSKISTVKSITGILLSMFVVAACGGEATLDRRTDSSHDDSTPTGESKRPATFALTLPLDLKEAEDKEQEEKVAEEDPQHWEAGNFINFACDGSAKKLDNYKGILVVNLLAYVEADQWKEEDEEEKEKLDDEKSSAKEFKIIESLKIPFSCTSKNAALSVSNLQAGIDYVLEAEFFGLSKPTHYVGKSSVFTDNDSEIKLVMELERKNDVKVNVIFQDNSAKEAADEKYRKEQEEKAAAEEKAKKELEEKENGI